MPNGPIDSYNGNGLTLAAYLDGILQRNNELNGVATAPHKNFWETLTYQQFTTGNVPGISFGPRPPYPILVVGDATSSNFVLALQGVGPLFDNNTGAFGRPTPTLRRCRSLPPQRSNQLLIGSTMAAPTPEAVNDPGPLIPAQATQAIAGFRNTAAQGRIRECGKRRAAVRKQRAAPKVHCPRSAQGWARVRNFASIRVLELLGSETVATVS